MTEPGDRPGRSRLVMVVVAAALLRLLVAVPTAREVGDVARYGAVARHVLDVSWNPYQAPRLYPYPPVWVWAEAGSEWVSRATGLPFALVVKVPVITADVALVALLGTVGGLPAAVAYALHPVALLVSGVHAQFDVLAALMLVLALRALAAGRSDASALALSGAIALKSFPVLFVPLLALTRPGTASRLRYAALATVPVALILVPYLLHDLPAVRRELLGYGGVADFGWIGIVRGARALVYGTLEPGPSRQWPLLTGLSKALFLAAWAALVLLRARRVLMPGPTTACLLVVLGFLGLYGAISAQYLLWAVPLALLVLPRSWNVAYGAACTVALLGFYGFFLPVLLWGDGVRLVPRALAAQAWFAGLVLVQLMVMAGLVQLVREARPRPA